MKTVFFLFITALLLTISCNSFDAFANNNELQSVGFLDKSEILCNDKNIKIPPYFPFENAEIRNDNFIIWNNSECSEEKLELYISKSENCLGQNVCNTYTFIQETTNERFLNFLNVNEENIISLSKGFSAMYKPSECNAYCNEAELFAFKGDLAFMIGTNHENGDNSSRDELIKSANSYIDAIEN